MKVWYGGEGFFSSFLAFIRVLYITQVLFILSSQFTLKSICYTKYFDLTFSIDVFSLLSNLYSQWND